MAYAKANLRKDVLLELGVLPIGQEPSAEDAEKTDQAIDSAQAVLLAKGIAHWAVTDIPAEVQTALIQYVAARLSGPFQVVPAVSEDAALRELRALTSAAPDYGEPIRAEYF